MDEYFTKPEVAVKCWQLVLDYLGGGAESKFFIEPSAGAGAFYFLMPPERRLGFDILSRHNEIVERDFLTWRPADVKDFVVVGNPPFGHRIKMALDFINHSATFADTIAFILPITFARYTAHRFMRSELRLHSSYELEPNSFIDIAKNSSYALNSCFQIWTKNPDSADLRIRHKPPITHLDFKAFTTRGMADDERTFWLDWDFGVLRQGWGDFDRRETDQANCERKHAWIFFKARNQIVLNRLWAMDFEAMINKQMMNSGLSINKIVSEYTRLYGEGESAQLDFFKRSENEK